MTTEPRTAPNDDAIPAWFLDFAQENARQHAELAERIAALQIELASLRGELAGVRGEVATEIAALRLEVATEIAAVRQELAEQIAGVHEQIAALRVETAERENRLLKWMVGTVLAVATIWGGATYGIVTALTS